MQTLKIRSLVVAIMRLTLVFSGDWFWPRRLCPEDFSFLMFYAGMPANFGKVDSVRFENGALSIEDAAGHKMALRASLPLSDQP